MKKVTAKFIADEGFNKSKMLAIKQIREMSEYEEVEIKHDEHSYTFDFLIDSAKLCGKGIYYAVRGFAGMSMWAVVTIIEGLKWLFKGAFSKEDGGKKNAKVKIKN